MNTKVTGDGEKIAQIVIDQRMQKITLYVH